MFENKKMKTMYPLISIPSPISNSDKLKKISKLSIQFEVKQIARVANPRVQLSPNIIVADPDFGTPAYWGLASGH